MDVDATEPRLHGVVASRVFTVHTCALGVALDAAEGWCAWVVSLTKNKKQKKKRVVMSANNAVNRALEYQYDKYSHTQQAGHCDSMQERNGWWRET